MPVKREAACPPFDWNTARDHAATSQPPHQPHNRCLLTTTTTATCILPLFTSPERRVGKEITSDTDLLCKQRLVCGNAL